MKYNIPFIKPHFPNADEIGAAYSSIVASNWFTNFGPYEQTFRRNIEDYIAQDTHAVTVTNATLGLNIAIAEIFSGRPGSQVIVPSFTFAAGPEMLIAQGLRPVLIDIDARTMQPSLEEAANYLSQNDNDVAGILLCNIFGVGNPDIQLWEELAEKYDKPLIIDSAAGLGSMYKDGSKIGAHGSCEIFSLHATKPFAVGEGGIILTQDESLAKRLRELTNFGFNSERNIASIGTNAKMQEINAAIGIRQLEGFNDRLLSRRSSLSEYKRLLSPLGYGFQANDDLSTVPFVSAIAPTSETAQNVLNVLQESSIEARKYYYPLHEEEVIAQNSTLASTFNITKDIYSRIISLPLHDGMDKKDISAIVELMKAGA